MGPIKRKTIHTGWVLALIALSGCSLFNKPDRNLIVRDAGPEDGGLDTFEETGPDAILDLGPDGFGDAGPDAADAGPDAGPPEDCATDIDEDQNGLAGCADFACVGIDRCCDGGGGHENLRFAELSNGLLWLLSDGFPTLSGNVRFGVGPRVVVRRDVCDPLAQGIDYHIAFNIVADPSDGEYAAFTLSSVSVATPSRLTEFAAKIEVLENRARISLSRGNEVLGSFDGPIGSDRIVEMVVRLRPSTDDEGNARLSIRASIEQGAFPPQLDLGPVLYVEDLLPHCQGDSGDGTPGLYIGLEGNGNSIQVVATDAAYSVAQACNNPTVFERDGSLSILSAQGDRDSEPLDWDVAWSEGGIRSPSLSNDGSRWHVYAEASHQQPELEPTFGGSFPWVIGHSASQDMAPYWEPWLNPVSGGAPAVGSAGMIVSAPAYHHDLGAEVVYMYQSGEALYGAVGGNTPQEWVEGSGECRSVHQPDLGRVGDNLLIVYLCETDAGTSIRFRARTSSGGDQILEPAEMASARFFGEAAAHGLQDLAILVDPVGDPPSDTDFILRLWAIALGRREASLVLGTAGIKLVGGMITSITLTPYPANPVATASSLFPRDEGVVLQGIAVARVPSPAVNQLRFLVGRRVEFMGGGRRWDFAPVGQVWRVP